MPLDATTDDHERRVGDYWRSRNRLGSSTAARCLLLFALLRRAPRVGRHTWNGEAPALALALFIESIDDKGEQDTHRDSVRLPVVGRINWLCTSPKLNRARRVSVRALNNYRKRLLEGVLPFVHGSLPPFILIKHFLGCFGRKRPARYTSP